MAAAGQHSIPGDRSAGGSGAALLRAGGTHTVGEADVLAVPTISRAPDPGQPATGHNSHTFRHPLARDGNDVAVALCAQTN